MFKFSGKSIYKGIVSGPVYVLKRNPYQIGKIPIQDSKKELRRLRKAREQAEEQLQALYDQALKDVGEADAAVFLAHQMILKDKGYMDAIEHKINDELVNAEYAVFKVGHHFSQTFASMEDEYLKARYADVLDVSERLIRNLQKETQNTSAACRDKQTAQETGKAKENSPAAQNAAQLASTPTASNETHMPSLPSILVSDDISPSEAIQLDREKILAFVTIHGSSTSHTAILSRTMGIPALFGVPLNLNEIHSGMMAVVDGFKEEVIFEPDAEILQQAQERQKNVYIACQHLLPFKDEETVTLDGHKIALYANIGSIQDLNDVYKNGAEGIGLFRSEFLYLSRSSYPSEEEQFTVYKQVLQAMGSKEVVIRTLDIGSEKKADYFHLSKESDPALGYRGIRICLKQPEMFKVQLRALLRAAVYGNLSVMYPMITSLEEVQQIFSIIASVKDDLEKKQIPYKVPKQGVMIETPAAVMISDDLAEEVDFFSLGTNDLTQYTLAIDRKNEQLDDFYNPHHKAILRMIEMTTQNAHKKHIPVGICGELGADMTLTQDFVRMGIDELSVPPSMILPLRKKIRNMTAGELKSEV